MAITALYENSAAISTTEYSLTNNSTSIATKTDDGIFQLFLNLTNMVAGDQYELKVYEKVTSAGSQIVIHKAVFTGAQSPVGFVLPALVLMHGWDITLDKLAGTDRTIFWSIRQVA